MLFLPAVELPFPPGTELFLTGRRFGFGLGFTATLLMFAFALNGLITRPAAVLILGHRARSTIETRQIPARHQKCKGETDGSAPTRISGEGAGGAGYESNDSRRWQNNPHLRVSLEYLDRIFDYLEEREIPMYRMSSDLAPYATHPDLPQFHGMLREADRELRKAGAQAMPLGLRLSFHPSQYVILNTPDEALAAKSVWDVSTQAEILDRMELGPEAVVVIHVGGVYGDRKAGCERWVRTWERLPEHARACLVLENDDLRYSVADVLWIHERTGVRLIFDYQHWWCFNPEGVPMREALDRMLATWQGSARPKVHFSSARTEMRETARRNRKTGRTETVLQPPLATQHGDYANAFEFCTFMREHAGREFDVMLESKAKDLAVLRLRRDMVRFAPDVAARFGIRAGAGGEEVDEMSVRAGDFQ
jgi:UV DNA damage endonuclease